MYKRFIFMAYFQFADMAGELFSWQSILYLTACMLPNIKCYIFIYINGLGMKCYDLWIRG